MTRLLRLLRVGAHLAAGCAMSLLAYPLLTRGTRRALRRTWARDLLALLHVEVRSAVAPLAPGALVVANHVSWLDAVVLQALADCAVVAKADARRWPLLGALLARNETLFVERRPVRSLLVVIADIGARLARGECVAVFPEGTTSDGTLLRPFRPALFEPAVRGRHPVHALAFEYRDHRGRRCLEAAYIDDMTLWESLCAIAALPSLHVDLASTAEIGTAGLRRRDAAHLAHASIQDMIGGDGRALAARDAQHARHLAHPGHRALELGEIGDLERKTHEREIVAALRAHGGDVDALARERIADVA